MYLYLDGAHTEESIQFCLQWFKNQPPPPHNKPVQRILVFNCGFKKRVSAMLKQLAVIDFEIALFTPMISGLDRPLEKFNEATLDKDHLDRTDMIKNLWINIKQAKSENAYVTGNISETMTWLNKKQKENPNVHYQVLVTGSLYLVGGVLNYLNYKIH